MISRDVEKAGRLSVGGWWIEMPSNFLNNPMMVYSHLWNFFKKFSKFSNRHLVRFCGIFKKTIIWSIWLTTFNGNPRIIIIKLVLLKIISSNFSIERGQSVMSYQAGWTSTNKHAKQQMILRSFFFFLISTRHRVEHYRLDIVDNSDCRKHRSTDVVHRKRTTSC